MEGAAKLDYQVRYEATVKDLQDKLALAQLENAKLREALVSAEKIIVKAILFESEAEQYLSESDYELNGCLGDSSADINVNGKNVLLKVRQALSTLTTHAELDAYVDAKFGEPVAWKYKTNKVHTWITEDKPPEDAYDEGALKPLYAKKG